MIDDCYTNIDIKKAHANCYIVVTNDGSIIRSFAGATLQAAITKAYEAWEDG